MSLVIDTVMCFMVLQVSVHLGGAVGFYSGNVQELLDDVLVSNNAVYWAMSHMGMLRVQLGAIMMSNSAALLLWLISCSTFGAGIKTSHALLVQ